MTQSPIQTIRIQVQRALTGLGASDELPMDETILVRDGCYCGRRFEQDGLTAVWFLEENQIKCFDREGALAQVLRGEIAANRAA